MSDPVPPAPPAAYPAELETVWQPAGGPALRIRALRSDDLERELRFIEGLSEATRYQRMQYFAREVSAVDAARLLQMDYVDNLALGAVREDSSGGEIVGVSRYAGIPGTRRAECAIVVSDAWQGRGLGTELMRCLAVAAHARGFETHEGQSLGDNQRILAWARRFGFHASTEAHSGGLQRIIVELAQLPS